MTFVIEGLGLTSGGGKAGLMKLLPALAGAGRRHSFVAVIANCDECRHLERPNLKLIMMEKPRSLLRRHLLLQRTIPRICTEHRADALLCLGNFGPRRPGRACIVLLHNACHTASRSIPGVRPSLRERLIRSYARNYLRRLPADACLVVQTELMKAQVMAAHGVPESCVTVIPDADGLPESIAGCEPSVGEAALESPAPIGIPEHGSVPVVPSGNAPFTFLCLARYYPHKNLEVLLEAMKRLPVHTRVPARCLITIDGSQHRRARKLLNRIAPDGLASVVINVGPLAGRAVVEAYRAADAFILPTLLESFGRTYLEAIRFDLPILTSDRDFAREVCKRAAVYFDPLNPASVAESMARVMLGRVLREQLAVERRRIRIPTWDEVAGRFLEVLERAALARERGIAGVSPVLVRAGRGL